MALRLWWLQFIDRLVLSCTKVFNVIDITPMPMPELIGDEFNKEKFKQVLHYIITSCGHIDNVGKTVLFKLPYFSDLNYYELYEEKMTGESYIHIPRGPAPRHFDQIINELESEGKIHQFMTNYYGKNQNKYTSLCKPETDLLSEKELKVINDVISRCAHMNATEISEWSHKDMPYKATKDGCEIEYDLVFYRDATTSIRNYDEND
jgi:hypothetical protein